MDTNTKKQTRLIYPELSYDIVGICFNVHNELGQFAREKQYADELEKELTNKKLNYKRELAIGESGNIVDFLVEEKIIIELKACRKLISEHFRQTQNYLQISKLKLALLVNFRERYLRPIRIIRID